MEKDTYGGLTSIIVKQVMEELGIKQETVDKIQSIIDNVDIQEYDEKTVIQIKIKDITIVVNK
tara:strand:- start:959 stop:1147 length:189 start_codon:yes stop_codon:yes gene_type:complete